MCAFIPNLKDRVFPLENHKNRYGKEGGDTKGILNEYLKTNYKVKRRTARSFDMGSP